MSLHDILLLFPIFPWHENLTDFSWSKIQLIKCKQRKQKQKKGTFKYKTCCSRPKSKEIGKLQKLLIVKTRL